MNKSSPLGRVATTARPHPKPKRTEAAASARQEKALKRADLAEILLRLWH